MDQHSSIEINHHSKALPYNLLQNDLDVHSYSSVYHPHGCVLYSTKSVGHSTIVHHQPASSYWITDEIHHSVQSLEVSDACLLAAATEDDLVHFQGPLVLDHKMMSAKYSNLVSGVDDVAQVSFSGPIRSSGWQKLVQLLGRRLQRYQHLT